MATNIVGMDASNNIKQFSNTEFNLLADYVLEIMAANTYATTLSSTGTGNTIGTFTDTARQFGPGNTDLTIVSSTFTLSQYDATTMDAQPDLPNYMGLNQPDANTTELKENMTTPDDLADDILARMVSGGVNSYFINEGVTAPSGGSWASVASFNDTINNLSATVTTYTLWHKMSEDTAGSAALRPLKLQNNELKRYDDQDLLSIIKKVEERFLSTGVGSYVLQASAPATGTWAQHSDAIVDSRRTTGPDTVGAAYTAVSRTANYTATYTAETSVNYTKTYLGPLYSGPYRPPTGNLVPYIVNAYYGPSGGFLQNGQPAPFPMGPSFSYQGPPPPGQQNGYYRSSNVNYTGGTSTNYDTDYTGDFTTDYIGTVFITTVQNTTETVSTLRLWVRTA